MKYDHYQFSRHCTETWRLRQGNWEWVLVLVNWVVLPKLLICSVSQSYSLISIHKKRLIALYVSTFLTPTSVSAYWLTIFIGNVKKITDKSQNFLGENLAFPLSTVPVWVDGAYAPWSFRQSVSVVNNSDIPLASFPFRCSTTLR